MFFNLLQNNFKLLFENIVKLILNHSIIYIIYYFID